MHSRFNGALSTGDILLEVDGIAILGDLVKAGRLIRGDLVCI
jgi:hypothetical protein